MGNAVAPHLPMSFVILYFLVMVLVVYNIQSLLSEESELGLLVICRFQLLLPYIEAMPIVPSNLIFRFLSAARLGDSICGLVDTCVREETPNRQKIYPIILHNQINFMPFRPQV